MKVSRLEIARANKRRDVTGTGKITYEKKQINTAHSVISTKR
jgi:hypothetical protein